jgi:hypothetical protein
MSEIVEVMARVDVDTSRYIQGFLYGDHHVIRDIRKSPGQQEIFRASIADCGNEQWAEECRMASRRVKMQAIITALDAAGFAIVPKDALAPPDVIGALEAAESWIADGGYAEAGSGRAVYLQIRTILAQTKRARK